MKGFKAFLLRGNVVELATAVVIGVAFGVVITAFVKDLVTGTTRLVSTDSAGNQERLGDAG